LAFLAPDITEAILDGKQDPDLSLEKCAGEIPFEWSLQRAILITSMASSRSKRDYMTMGHQAPDGLV
jgi:hypothetical protein